MRRRVRGHFSEQVYLASRHCASKVSDRATRLFDTESFVIDLEVRTKYIRWPHRGDGPEQRFELLCNRLRKLSPSQWYNVGICRGPDF